MRKLALITLVGCLAVMQPNMSVAEDSLCYQSKKRVFSFMLPFADGMLEVYASGENKWYGQKVEGHTGTLVIGRHGDDYGVEYQVRYTDKVEPKLVHHYCVIKVKE